MPFGVRGADEYSMKSPSTSSAIGSLARTDASSYRSNGEVAVEQEARVRFRVRLASRSAATAASWRVETITEASQSSTM